MQKLASIGDLMITNNISETVNETSNHSADCNVSRGFRRGEICNCHGPAFRSKHRLQWSQQDVADAVEAGYYLTGVEPIDYATA